MFNYSALWQFSAILLHHFCWSSNIRDFPWIELHLLASKWIHINFNFNSDFDWNDDKWLSCDSIDWCVSSNVLKNLYETKSIQSISNFLNEKKSINVRLDKSVRCKSRNKKYILTNGVPIWFERNVIYPHHITFHYITIIKLKLMRKRFLYLQHPHHKKCIQSRGQRLLGKAVTFIKYAVTFVKYLFDRKGVRARSHRHVSM